MPRRTGTSPEPRSDAPADVVWTPDRWQKSKEAFERSARLFAQQATHHGVAWESAIKQLDIGEGEGATDIPA